MKSPRRGKYLTSAFNNGQSISRRLQYSPDSASLLYEKLNNAQFGSELFNVNVSTGVGVTISNMGKVLQPIWLKDNSRVIFVRQFAATSAHQLISVPAAGGGEVVLL